MADATPERWLPVVGYEGWYEVSDHGRVRRTATGKVLRFGLSGGGRGSSSKRYRAVTLYRDGKPRRHRVHVLVLDAFVGLRPPGHECNHKDGDKANNRVTNLEWLTRAANWEHAVRMGLLVPVRGERNRSAKLTQEQVAEIRRLGGTIPQREIGTKFGVSQALISRILNGERWPL